MEEIKEEEILEEEGILEEEPTSKESDSVKETTGRICGKCGHTVFDHEDFQECPRCLGTLVDISQRATG